MQMTGLVIFTVIGMAAIGGLSMFIYTALPKSALEFGSRHGRFAALGTLDRRDRTPSGKTRISNWVGIPMYREGQ
jgi:hypothetical protein